MTYFDDLETRSADERTAAQVAALRDRLDHMKTAPDAWRDAAASVQSLSDLPKLPVLRKSELSA